MITFEAFTPRRRRHRRHGAERVGTENRMLSYLPLAHSFERTWVEAASLVDGRLHLFFAESLDTFLQDLQRTQPTLFLSVPRLWLKFQQGVFAKMPPAKLDRLLGIPILGKIVAKKIRNGLGLDHVKLAGSGSAPIPPALIEWYRQHRPAAVRGLRHDRGQLVLARVDRGPQRAGLRRRADGRRAGEAQSRGRGADQVAGPVHRLLQAARTHRRVVHAGRLLPHRRPRRAHAGRTAEADRAREGTLQDGQGQVRRARADREPHQRAPDGRTVAGVRRRPARGARDGDPGRAPAAAHERGRACARRSRRRCTRCWSRSTRRWPTTSSCT